MFKSAAVLVGFLIAVSSIYYLVFWGHFGIDVFQYIDTSSIIKGLAYPLRTAASTLLVLGGEIFVAMCYLIWSNKGTKDLKEQYPTYYHYRKIIILKLILFISLSSAIIFGLIHWWTIHYDEIQYAVSSGEYALIGLSFTIAIAYAVIDNQLTFLEFKKGVVDAFNEQRNYTGAINYTLVGIAAYLVLSAISYGVVNSIKIEKHLSYDYVQDTSYLRCQGVYLNKCNAYLGVIGDKYFFLDFNGKYYFAVDKSKVSVIQISHYESLNSDLSLIDFFATHKPAIAMVLVSLLLIALFSVVLYRKNVKTIKKAERKERKNIT